MKKLTHSAAARAVAFILCLLCGLTALLCAAGYYMTRIDRDRTLPEPDSVSVYQNGIRVLLNNALQEERDTGEYPALPSGYSYVATDTSTGKVLYDGRTKNAVPLGISGGYFSEGVGIDVVREAGLLKRLAAGHSAAEAVHADVLEHGHRFRSIGQDLRNHRISGNFKHNFLPPVVCL